MNRPTIELGSPILAGDVYLYKDANITPYVFSKARGGRYGEEDLAQGFGIVRNNAIHTLVPKKEPQYDMNTPISIHEFNAIKVGHVIKFTQLLSPSQKEVPCRVVSSVANLGMGIHVHNKSESLDGGVFTLAITSKHVRDGCVYPADEATCIAIGRKPI